MKFLKNSSSQDIFNVSEIAKLVKFNKRHFIYSTRKNDSSAASSQSSSLFRMEVLGEKCSRARDKQNDQHNFADESAKARKKNSSDKQMIER